MAPRLIELVKPIFEAQNGSKRQLMEHLSQNHKLLGIANDQLRNVGHVGGEKSYIFLGSLAKLERSLMRWTINELLTKHKFHPVVVPNIIYDHIIEKCGFPTRNKHTQVYKVSGSTEESILDENSCKADSSKTHSCLAGTSEFALASIHIGDTITKEELPKKFCTLSRCYRAETGAVHSEWGLYRVHYFNKVEMLALTLPERSDEMHEEFLRIQKDIFSKLNLHFRILDMPKEDLGLSAVKKYDIEAWMEGRQRYGEISSASNCGDYQSSRLNIKYSRMVELDNQLQMDENFVHTVNGTACSSVRTMIALMEQNQTDDGRVKLPEVLVPFMGGVRYIPTSDDEKLLAELKSIPVGGDE